MLVREHRQRGIDSHGCRPFHSIFRHVHDGCLHFLVGIAEGFLEALAFFRRIGRDLLVWNLKAAKFCQVAVKPFSVRLTARVSLLQFFIVDHLSLHGIYKQHLSRMQALFYDDLARVNIKHTHLGRQDQCVIIRDIISGRTKAIPVKDGSHAVPVAEKNRRGPVPRLHHGGVVLIEILLLLGHILRIGPRFRNRDHDGKRQVHPAHHHEFNGIIQHGRVRSCDIDGRQHLVKLALQVF